MIDQLIHHISERTIHSFFRSKILQYKVNKEELDYLIPDQGYDKFSSLLKLGECTFENSDELLIFSCQFSGELSFRSSKKKQYELAKNVLKEDFKDGAIFIFYDDQGKFRFSFIRRYYDGDKKYSNWKRFTYFVDPNRNNKTFKKRIGFADFSSLDTIQEAFAVEQLSKEFYKDLSYWYFAAINEVHFPNENGVNQQSINSQALIRLITRIMFVWFMRQKDLIPSQIFDKTFLDKILNYSDSTGSTYYKAILQNLFFATLNTEQGEKRKWITTSGYGVQHFYRYPRYFIGGKEGDPANRFLELMKKIPFLNGGLFENLDIVEAANKEKDLPKIDIRIDCFSDNVKNEGRLTVPDYLFFGHRRADISTFLDDSGKTDVEVHGLIDILNRYDFTIDENTPDDLDVALDPELLGTVFENLLASYNPETQSTARKESGSFYTPRPIVDYMVKESLVYFLSDKSKLGEEVIRELVHLDIVVGLNSEQKSDLVDAISNLKILDPACGSGAFPMGCLQHMVRLLNVLDLDNELYKKAQKKKLKRELALTIDESNYEELKENIEEVFNNHLNDPDYARKLFLIQNCLYGVDIQSIAMQIAKLRFFISLLVEQNIDPQQPNMGIKPLPNLETKFVAANTLIQIQKPVSTQEGSVNQILIQNTQLLDKQDELNETRAKYFSARTYDTKRKYRTKDQELRDEIADLLVEDGWDNEAAHQVARWDPFDQNASSDWFDPEWMFGVDNFDVVIGNPPYIQLQKAAPGGGGIQYADVYKDQGYKTFERTGDIYCLFYEKGLESLHQGGILAYITSNKWMRANYGKSLRKYLATKNPLQIIDLGPGVFEAATVDTNILFVQNSATQKHQLLALELRDKEKIYTLNENDFTILQHLTEESWIILSPQELAIKEKIEHIGTPLKDWDVSINYGIKTGYNKAFIIDGTLKDQLIAEDPRSAEILKPIFRGRDIKRYKAQFADLWLITSHNGYITSDGTHVPRVNISEYPAVKNWLDNHWDSISKRYDKGSTPYNLRNCAYMEEFEKEKMVWKRIGSIIRFAYSEEFIYALDSNVILTGKSLKYLTAILNSKMLIRELLMNSPKTGTGDVIISVQALKPMKIPLLSSNEQSPFITLFDIIISKKAVGKDTQLEEQQIDLMVYKLYELTYDEILVVDPESTISREEYEGFTLSTSET